MLGLQLAAPGYRSGCNQWWQLDGWTCKLVQTKPLALQSTWKRNEKIKLFMIMHMAWRREKLGVGGSLTQSLDAQGPLLPYLTTP